MTPNVAKYILEQNGFDVSFDNMANAYNYLTEANVIDCIKDSINYIKRLHNSNDPKDRIDAKEQAIELKNTIKKDNILSNTAKKMLISLIFAAMGATTANAAEKAETLSNAFNKGDYISYINTIGDTESSNMYEPNKVDLENDAKHIAVAFHNADLQGIKVTEADESDSTTYNFNDNTTVSIDTDNTIYVYQRGMLVRQYYPNEPAMKAVLELASDFAK